MSAFYTFGKTDASMIQLVFISVLVNPETFVASVNSHQDEVKLITKLFSMCDVAEIFLHPA
jgi:hypothetical protein